MNKSMAMRNMLYIIMLLLAVPFASDAQNGFDEAVKAYQAEDYARSAELLENEINIQKEKGLESADLYYNLGNAYFRDNELAKAILNYERAILLDPGDRDIRHNLEFARTHVEDKIIPIDTFFLQSWFESIQGLQSSNAWAKLSVVLFLLFMGALAAFFFTKNVLVKKATFYVGIFAIVLVVFTNLFASGQKSKVLNRNTAVIAAGAVPIKSSPDVNSKELFILHSGTKVNITKDDGLWLEIEIENGNVGWITRDKLEVI